MTSSGTGASREVDGDFRGEVPSVDVSSRAVGPTIYPVLDVSKRPLSSLHPAVSVVVPTFNDAERLPASVGSVLNQTLHDLEVIVCDDASTDSTPEVAQALCDQDQRVRYHRLQANTGSASGPRNAGMELARAPWVFFLDSDDELPMHSLKNLLETGERTEAEVVSGRISRYHVERRKWSGWFLRLFTKEIVLNSVLDEDPERIFDTAPVAKLYRMDFLRRNRLRFEEGVLYEDLLFTLQLYCAVRRLVVIPEQCYTWRIFESAANKSVTNSRKTQRNLDDRIRINRFMDRWLVESGNSRHLSAKMDKFVRTDVALYVGDLVSSDDRWAEIVLDRFTPYCDSIPSETVAALPRLHRLALLMIAQRDLDGIRSVYRTIQNGEYGTDLVRRGGATYWSERLLRQGLDPGGLDVSELRLDEVPIGQWRLAHDVVAWQGDVANIAVSIATWDPFGRLTELAAELVLEVSARGSGGERLRVRPRATENQGHQIRSDYLIAAQDLPWDYRAHDQRFDFWVAMTAPGLDVERRQPLDYPAPSSRVFAEGFPESRSPVVPRINEVRPYRTLDNHLALNSPQGRRGMPRRAIRAARSSSAGQFGVGAVTRIEAAVRPKRRRGRKLAVFASHVGRGYSDSPKQIYEELRRSGWDGEVVWARDRIGSRIPGDVQTVVWGSREFRTALASADYWVDNQGFPLDVDKPTGTVYLQTWHGVPYKLMGLDKELLAKSREARRRHFMACARWDYLVAPSPYFRETFSRAFPSPATMLGPGTPRVDPLVARRGSPRAEADDRAVGILGPRADRNILYAPTFREHLAHSGADANAFFPLHEAAAELDGRARLLVRPHYLNRMPIPSSLAPIIHDAGAVSDAGTVLLATDVLVTDYSSIMFDYLVLARPMVLFVPDYAYYSGIARGSYFDLIEEAPGPVAHTPEQLWDLLASVEEWQDNYTARQESFRLKYGGVEDGNATRRVVEEVFLCE